MLLCSYRPVPTTTTPLPSNRYGMDHGVRRENYNAVKMKHSPLTFHVLLPEMCTVIQREKRTRNWIWGRSAEGVSDKASTDQQRIENLPELGKNYSCSPAIGRISSPTLPCQLPNEITQIKQANQSRQEQKKASATGSPIKEAQCNQPLSKSNTALTREHYST